MTTITFPQPGGQLPTYATYAGLPTVASDGAIAVVTGVYPNTYVYRATGATWEQIGPRTKNVIINGNFDFFQRGTGVTQTGVTSASGYLADRWSYNYSSAASTFTVSTSTSVPSVAQAGWQSLASLNYINTSGPASISATDVIEPFIYRVEGVDFEPLFGQQCCLSFWVRPTLAGTFSVSLANGALTRSYVTTFSVPTSFTWTFIVIPFVGDTAGTWAFGNTTGLIIRIAPLSGSTLATSTLNAWQAGDLRTAAGTTNWSATAGANLRIAQVQLTPGVFFSPFTRRGATIEAELELCQRYYEKSYSPTINPGTGSLGAFFTSGYAATTANGALWPVGRIPRFSVIKRAVPTVTLWSTGGTINTWNITGTSNVATLPSLVTDQDFQVINNTGSTQTKIAGTIFGQWAADAEL